MQGRKFLFQRSDLNQRTSMVLFSKCNFGQAECSDASMNLLSQFNLSRIQPFNENTNDSFYTPPMEKKPAPTPKAPIKLKKQPKKGDLKPKKLLYTEDELDNSNVTDSGIHMEDDTQCCKKHTTKCHKFAHSQKQRTLCTRLDRDEVQINDKENDKNIIGNSTNKANKISVAQESSVVLPQYGNDSYWIEVLQSLQPERDIGLWVQCCRKVCGKWRYIEDYHDPSNVPKKWFCKMNPENSLASCNAPEEPSAVAVESDLIENAYNAGSLVWARIQGYPWWPGIVNDCPDTFTYYKLYENTLEPISYYVTFFNDNKAECAWIHRENLKPFVAYKYSCIIKRTKYHGVDYAEPLKRAYQTATEALPLSILERLKKFSFVALYTKSYDVNNNRRQLIHSTGEMDIPTEMEVNSDEEVPCSLSTGKELTLKEYYSKVICNRNRVN